MLEELKKLKDLQLVDSEIFNLEEELDNLPEKNEKLLSQIEDMEGKLKELRNAIGIQMEEKQKREDILKKGEDKLKNITGKQQSAIRNKEEYNSLLREIDNIKRFNRDISDEVAEIDKEVGFKTTELQLIESESLENIKEFKTIIANNEKRMVNLEKDLEKKYRDREKIAEKIRPVVARKYQRIFDSSLNGKAIALVEERVCLGCNMTLPPELYNLVLRSKRIEICPNCQCILVPSEKAEIKKEEPDEPLE